MIKPNKEAEQSLLGAILIDADKIMPEVVGLLDRDDFLIPENRTIYDYCVGYFEDGKPVDMVTLLYQFGEAAEYKIYISELAQMVPSTRNWRAYAQLIKETAMRSRAYDRAIELQGLLAAHADLEECQDAAVAASNALTCEKSTNTVSSEEGFVRFYASLGHPVEYIRTGFSKVDSCIFMERGDYVVIGARPSIGKTAITLQMMLSMSRSRRVAYFSLETGAVKLFTRMAANITGISLSKIKSRENLGYLEIQAAKADFAQRDFFVVEAAGMSVAEIRAKTIQLGAQIVIVDYIGLVRSSGKTPYERTTNASIALHTMAQTCNVTVIVVSQLSRDGGRQAPSGKPAPPDITHLRESGQIEQDADIIMLLHASDKKTRHLREIGIVKNKEGRTGVVEVAFDGNTQRFTELEDHYGV